MHMTEAEMQARDDEDLRNMQFLAWTLIAAFLAVAGSIGAGLWWLLA